MNLLSTVGRALVNKPIQGTSGTEIYGGYITDEDHSKEWRDENVVKNVKKMLKTDALIKASMVSFKLPILAGTFEIIPASEQPIDMKVAEFVEANLFNSPWFNWNDILREQLTFLDYGFAFFSKRYTIYKGQNWLQSFSFRLPKTFERVFPDQDGNISYVEQHAYDWVSKKYDVFRIDVDNLFLLTNDRLAKNYRGESFLRPVWRPFYLKDLELRINSAAFEKWGIGTPVGTLKKASAKADLENALKNLRSHEKGYVLMSESDYSIDILRNDSLGKTGMIESIAMHNKEIYAAFNRQFMSLGQSDVGARAVGDVQQGIFFDAVEAVARQIETTWNRPSEGMSHIQQLVDLNFNGITEYPRLDVQIKSVNMLLQTLGSLPTLATAGLLTLDDNTEEALRQSLGLPEMSSEPNVKKISEDMPPVIEPDITNVLKKYEGLNFTPNDTMAKEAEMGLFWRREYGRGGTAVGVARARDIQNKKQLSPDTVRRMYSYFKRHEVDKQASGFSRGEDGFPSNGRIAWALWGGDAGYEWSRKLRDAMNKRDTQNALPKAQTRSDRVSADFLAIEAKILNVTVMKKRLNDSQRNLKDIVEPIVDEVEKALVEAGTKILVQSKDMKDLADRLERFDVPYRGKMVDAVTKEGQGLYDFGVEQVQEELARQTVTNAAVNPPITEVAKDAKRSIRETVKITVGTWFDKILSEWKTAVVSLFKQGDVNSSVIRDRVQRVSRNKIVQELGGVMNESFGLGRNGEIAKQIEKVDAVMYRSEIMDEATCGPCIEIDGKEFKKTDSFYQAVANGPYVRCEGRDLCRGVNFLEVQ